MYSMRENLFLRTDTLPEEIPLLFTNKVLYNNFKLSDINELDNFDNTILKSFYTVPFYFYIPKNNLESRKMSLLHPLAQLQMFQYILRYDQLIVSYCKSSKFSVRSPMLRNQPVFVLSQTLKTEIKRIEQEFSFSKDTTITTDETEAYFYNYFSYKNYKKITDLYKSNKFKRDMYKYKFFKKLDIQNFFGSIYTHSLAWAIFGNKAIAKKYKGRNYDEIFANATDKVCQIINFNETNGIVIGPEFSRVISELLLTRIDINLFNKLEDADLKMGNDYKIYRFMDDYFIFTNNNEVADIIEKNLFVELETYNLKLNVNKTKLQTRPFFESDPAIIKLIHHLDNFKKNHPPDESLTKYKKSYNNLWHKLQQNIELIIHEYPKSTSKILNYFLKFIRSFLNLKVHHFNLAYILEIITNVYSLSINYHSTHNLIATFAVLTQKIKHLSNEERVNLHEKIEYLEERFFQHLFITLKNNIDNINDMYDLLIYLKTLPKKISSDFLCEILEKNNNYFVICSVAYYILDDNLTTINPGFKTVFKKLTLKINNFQLNYKDRGADSKFLEAEYFYFLNDFSYYPGFNSSLQIQLKNKLIESSKNFYHQNNTDKSRRIASIINTITSDSYYSWKKTPDDFIKEIAKKSSNLLNRKRLYN